MEFPIRSISDLEKISSAAKWQFFEKLAAFIFEENGFDAKQNVVVRSEDYKRQFDVVAKRFNVTYLVECKKWKSKYQLSALKSAAAKHLERCIFYESLHSGEFRPLIVTLMEESVSRHNGVLIVPIAKLNCVINNFESIENHG